MIRTIARSYRAAFAGLTRDVWLLAVVALVNRSGSMVLPFFSLYLTRELGLGLVQAGTVLSLYGVGSILGAWVGGRLSDGIGTIRAQQASLILSGVGFVWISRLESLAAIYPAVLLLSVVVESFRPANMAAFVQYAPPDTQARSFALLRLAANLGVGIGPAVGGFLALYSYAWLFIVDAVTCWFAVILLTIFFHSAPLREEAPQDGAVTRSPWRDGPFLALMFLTVVLAIVFFQVWSTLPLYFRAVYGFREDLIGRLLALNALVIALFEMVLIYWIERLPRMALIGTGGFLVCTGFALMPLGSSIPFVVSTILIWTVGEMLALPLLTTVVAKRSGPGARGSYMGLYTMAFSIAFVLAPAGGTYVYARFGPETLWYGIGVLSVPLFIAALTLTRSLRTA